MISGERGTTFVYQDANWNVIGLTAPAGHLVEEYHYTPYGRMVATTHSAFGDATGDGDVDAADNTAFTAAQTSYNRNFDADFNGIINSFDQAAFTANYNASAPSVVVPNRFLSPNDNPYTFTGRRLDAATSLMHYRYRAYHPQLKSFMQRDPLGYQDGPNDRSYVNGEPISGVDPLGLLSLASCLVADELDSEVTRLKQELEKLGRDRDTVQTTVTDINRLLARLNGNTVRSIWRNRGWLISLTSVAVGIAVTVVSGNPVLGGVVGLTFFAAATGDVLSSGIAPAATWITAARGMLNTQLNKYQLMLEDIDAQMEAIRQQIKIAKRARDTARDNCRRAKEEFLRDAPPDVRPFATVTSSPADEAFWSWLKSTKTAEELRIFKILWNRGFWNGYRAPWYARPFEEEPACPIP